jgi:hypothetical protein
MRKLCGLLAAGGLVLGMAGIAQAEPIPFEGTLQLQLGTLPSLTVTGTGNATVNGSAGLGHLNTMTIAGGNGLYGTATIPLTDPANPTLVSLVGTFDLLEPGVFANISGGPPGGGVMPVGGLFRLCILVGPGCPFSIAIPLTVNGTKGVGIGGILTVNGFAKAGISISITGNPWTIGTVAITGIPTDNGGFTTSTAAGFAHGPQSLTSSTANPSGVVQLVTPVLVQTNLKGNEVIALFGTLTVHFTPEPGTLLLFGSGIAALGVAARRRKQ